MIVRACSSFKSWVLLALMLIPALSLALTSRSNGSLTKKFPCFVVTSCLVAISTNAASLTSLSNSSLYSNYQEARIVPLGMMKALRIFLKLMLCGWQHEEFSEEFSFHIFLIGNAYIRMYSRIKSNIFITKLLYTCITIPV